MGEYADYLPDRPDGERFGADVVRKARPEDADTIIELTCARHNLEPQVVRPRIENELAGIERGDPSCVFVAQIGHHLVGFGRARQLQHARDGLPLALPEGWYLTGVIVDPTWRRRGLGELLTAARLEWIARRTDAAYYVASRENRASIALHERFGFHEIARGFAYPRADLTADRSVAYELTLPSAGDGSAGSAATRGDAGGRSRRIT